MQRYDKLSDMNTNGYTSVDKAMPIKPGIYECIVRGGSMSPYYYKSKMRFVPSYRGFGRFDWDYTVMWKEIRE